MKKTSTTLTCSTILLVFLGITGCTTPFINREKYEAEATAYFNTGEEFFKKGDYDKAVSTFTNVIKTYPRSQLADDAYYLASLSFAKKKDWEHAVGASLNLAKSYPASPLIPKTKIILAEGYNNIGMYEEALLNYIEAYIVSDIPKEREIASSQAKNLLGREKDYSVLLDIYNRYGNTDAAEWILYRLGDLSFQLENYEASERHLSELKRRFPKSPYIDKIGGKDISASKLKSELTIGVLLPLTGSLSSYGLNVKQGIDLANDLKGGATVKLVEYDTRSDPGEALRGAEYLLKEEASVIIGPLTSSGITAVTKAAARNGTVVISPTATDPSLLSQYECLFELNSYSEEETKAIASYALSQGMTQFGVFYPNSENGKFLADVFAKAVERGGGKVLYSSQLSDTVTEIQKTIVSVRYSPAQAVFLPFTKTQLMSVVPEIAYYRLKVKILGIDDFADSDILRRGGVPFENVWFASPPCKIETSYPFEVFFSQYKSLYGKDPNWESALGYDAYNFIIAAFSSGKSESLCRSLRQLDNRRGTLGRLVFIDSPQEPSLRIYTIKNEEIKEVVR